MDGARPMLDSASASGFSGGPREDGAEVVGANQHRGNGDGEHSPQRKLPTLAAPPVRDRAKNPPQCLCH